MVGAVDQHHRVVWQHGIQVVARALAAVGQIRHVVAVADHPVTRCHRVGRHELLEHALDVGDARDRPRGHAGHVGPLDDLRCVGEVAVGVDERRHEREAAQVDDLGVVAAGRHDLGLVAHGQNASAADGDRLDTRPGVVHRENRAAAEDALRRVVDHDRDGSHRRLRGLDFAEFLVWATSGTP